MGSATAITPSAILRVRKRQMAELLPKQSTMSRRPARLRRPMKPIVIAGVLLLVFGLAALVYRGVSYTSRETVIDIGPVHATSRSGKDAAHSAGVGDSGYGLAAWRCWSPAHASATEVGLTN
jgi:hypothetical protein